MVLTTTILPPNVLGNATVAAIVAAQNSQNNGGFDFLIGLFILIVAIVAIVLIAFFKGWIFKRQPGQGTVGRYLNRPGDPAYDGTIEKAGVVYPIDPLRSSETIKDPTGQQKGKVSKIPTFKGGIEDYIEVAKEDFDIDRDKIDEILEGHTRLRVRDKKTIAEEVKAREFEYNAMLNRLNYFQDLFKRLQGNPVANEIINEQIRGMHGRSVFRKENDRNLDVPRDAYGNPVPQPGQNGQK